MIYRIFSLVVAAILIPCIDILCGIVPKNSLAVMFTCFTIIPLCFFAEERVYKAGSVKEAIKKMGTMDWIRYALLLILSWAGTIAIVTRTYTMMIISGIIFVTLVLLQIIKKTNKSK